MISVIWLNWVLSPSINTLKEIKLKENLVNDIVCHCFGFSVNDIEKDYLDNEVSTIMKKIKMEKKFGNCQCATKNPKGQ